MRCSARVVTESTLGVDPLRLWLTKKPGARNSCRAARSQHDGISQRPKLWTGIRRATTLVRAVVRLCSVCGRRA